MIKTPSHNSGFTLIEAVVAMVIIGMTMVPVMLLISQSMIQLIKVKEINDRALAVKSALAIIESINPASSPTGSVTTGDTTLTWNSNIIVKPNKNVQIGAGLAGYSISFHNVEIDILRDDRSWFGFNLRKVGYKRINATGVPGTGY